MLSCSDMKKGEIYMCQDCGLELQVVKECEDTGTSGEEKACHPGGGTCTFACCGKELVKKP
jgi:hypothetical protein